LLGVTKGITVLTKADLVDEDWLELVKEDVLALVAGTFLEDAPIVVASAVAGRGIDTIKALVDEVLDQTPERDARGLPRLSVDRAFSVSGHGTIVTGTLVSGSLTSEERVNILPGNLSARIRSIQVHGKGVRRAEAGQRVALNLAGIDRAQVGRGSVLTSGDWLRPSNQFAARLELLSGATRALKNLSRVHLHYGTAESIGRVVLLEHDQILPGQNALARIRTQDPVVLARGDRFIIRSYSPVTTIGGGVVIASPSTHRRRSQAAVQDLLAREKADPEEDVRLLLAKPPYFLSRDEIASRIGVTVQVATEVLDRLLAGQVLRLLGTKYVLESVLESTLERAVAFVTRQLDKRPFLLSVAKEEIRRVVASDVDAREFGHVLQVAQQRAQLNVQGARVSVPGYEGNLTPRLEEAVQTVLERLAKEPFSPPSPDALVADLGLSTEEQADLLARLCEQGSTVRLADNMIISADALSSAKHKVIEKCRELGSISVSEFRDLLGTSRRHALPILEYFDQQKITVRSGDRRVLFGSR